MKNKHYKDLFNFPNEVIYLNNASFSPNFKSVEIAGIEAVRRKNRPDFYKASDLFDPVTELKNLFAKLIDTNEVNRVVTIPSVSYGLANAANNVILNEGDEIILIEEQFPSNVYIWKDLAEKYKAKIITIKNPKNDLNWNTAILDAITQNTAVVSIGHIHWANGFVFDLKAIRAKTIANNALLIIDGSQSVGAMPFSIKDIQPDALVCAGYKWLFGPYGSAYAYYGSYFDNGNAIEKNWSTRLNSEDFAGLTNYQTQYKPLAQRYSAGQSGSFIYVSMQIAALKEVLKINPVELQDYCYNISNSALEKLKTIGFISAPSHLRAKHLFGVEIPKSVGLEKLKSDLKNNNIHVSIRGQFMRVSCHLYNSKEHFKTLANFLISKYK